MNTIDWGQAAVNNTIGFGQGAKIGGSSFTNLKSIELDGIDDYVDIGSPSVLSSVTTMSISCWFKTTASSGVLVGADDQSLGRRFLLQVNSSKARFLYFNSSVQFYFAISTTSVDDGNWHNVVSVLDGTSIKVYLDGVLEGTNTGTGNMKASTLTPINIGQRSYATSKNNFQGNIDETSIFNTALTQTNVTDIYNLGVPNDISLLSPLSWWRCGDGDTAPTLTDNGSGGNDGTMTNFTTFSTDVPT